MKSENNLCIVVQENIAWGKALSVSDQNHVFSCQKCNEIALSFEEIDSLIKATKVDVPLGFSDKVMAKICESERPTFFANLREIFEMLSNNQILRWGVGGTSFLIAFAAH